MRCTCDVDGAVEGGCAEGAALVQEVGLAAPAALLGVEALDGRELLAPLHAADGEDAPLQHHRLRVRSFRTKGRAAPQG